MVVMLQVLQIKNCFKHVDTRIDFRNGLTAIVGPNESGKSLIFEMIRFALFGGVALRGKAEDYKNTEVTLSFVIDNKSYTVVRTIKKADLLLDGVGKIATGLKPVNQKICEILGYNIDIFDVANCANQDELNKLATMKPTERKVMVDNVIGLNLLDKVADKVAEKARESQIRIAGLRQVTETAPAAPARVHPEDINSDILKESINQLDPIANKVMVLEQWLKTEKKVPLMPKHWEHDEGIPYDAALIQEKIAEINLKNSRWVTLKAKFESLREPEITIEEINRIEAEWKLYKKTISDHILLLDFIHDNYIPEYTEEQLAQWRQDWDLISKWRTRRKLEASGHINCKSCGTVNYLAEDQLKDLIDLPKEPETPPIDDDRIIGYQCHWDKIKPIMGDIEGAKITLQTPPVAPSVSEEYLNGQKFLHQLKEEIEPLRAEYDELCNWAAQPQLNYTAALHDLIRFQNDMKHYNSDMEEYNKWYKEREENLAYYNANKDVPGQIGQLRDILPMVLVYENSIKNFEEQTRVYHIKLAELTQEHARLEQYNNAREGLKILRSKIKKHLVPSLNKVSSQLISQMTGGERNIIIIDEDFNITVDGQALQTLSGSGKAVANLAIRIGLGQVLVNKKFSVFMADEIDGSMDADRAGYTAECLKRLTLSIKQLLLISHKRPEADNYIELGRK